MQPDTTTKLDNRYEIIGTNPIRHDGIEKVTGSALYGADIVVIVLSMYVCVDHHNGVGADEMCEEKLRQSVCVCVCVCVCVW